MVPSKKQKSLVSIQIPRKKGQGGVAIRTVLCDYCVKPAELADDSVIYGRSYGHKIWLCRSCNAYVGCHRGTDKPLGRLADSRLRHYKRAAHDAFDPIWKFGRFRNNRSGAYAWMAEAMRLPKEKAHIGMFDVTDCMKLIQIINNERNYLYGQPE